jgi:hypothetical protein
MLRLCLGLAVLVSALMGVTYSQEKADDTPKVRGQLPAFYKKLGLRDDQIQKIYKIRAGYKGKLEELKRKMDQLKTTEKEDLEKVLTAEQLKRLRELRSGEKSPAREPEKTKPK